jgi:ornithine cyclodeaminase/alanine dehydrogenase-like protein (mu-crystallin family)
MGALGAKVVTVYKNNPEKFNIATVLGTIILLDEKTGAPIAIMDGGYLTAMRTGGVAGLATQLLAREDAKIHTMFGTGDMAGASTHLKKGKNSGRSSGRYWIVNVRSFCQTIPRRRWQRPIL